MENNSGQCVRRYSGDRCPLSLTDHVYDQTLFKETKTTEAVSPIAAVDALCICQCSNGYMQPHLCMCNHAHMYVYVCACACLTRTPSVETIILQTRLVIYLSTLCEATYRPTVYSTCSVDDDHSSLSNQRKFCVATAAAANPRPFRAINLSQLFSVARCCLTLQRKRPLSRDRGPTLLTTLSRKGRNIVLVAGDSNQDRTEQCGKAEGSGAE